MKSEYTQLNTQLLTQAITGVSILILGSYCLPYNNEKLLQLKNIYIIPMSRNSSYISSSDVYIEFILFILLQDKMWI